MSALNNLKTNVKLIGGFSIVALILVVIVAFTYQQTQYLGGLQDAGAKRARDAILAGKVSGETAVLYRIIADTELNLNFNESQVKWDTAKKTAEAELAVLDATADTSAEKAWSQEARTAYNKIVRLYEDQMVPALKAAGTSTPETLQMDSQMDGIIDEMGTPARCFFGFPLG